MRIQSVPVDVMLFNTINSHNFTTFPIFPETNNCLSLSINDGNINEIELSTKFCCLSIEYKLCETCLKSSLKIHTSNTKTKNKIN